jgi:hypothetical protein
MYLNYQLQKKKKEGTGQHGFKEQKHVMEARI